MKMQELKKRIASQLEKMIFTGVWQDEELTAETAIKSSDRLKAIEMLLSIISEEDEREIEISFKD